MQFYIHWSTIFAKTVKFLYVLYLSHTGKIHSLFDSIHYDWDLGV